MAKAVTNPTFLKTAERRAFVLQLRKAGATYRDITAACISRFGTDHLPAGWDERYAYKDVRRELDALRERMTVDTESIRTLELERLDSLLLSVWSLAVPGRNDTVDSITRFQAIDRALKIIAQRARLVPDLDQPVSLDAVTVRVIGGIDLDEL